MFHRSDLICESVGTVTETSSLQLLAGGEQKEFLDFARDSITGLWS